MDNRYKNPRTLVFTATYNERDNIGLLVDHVLSMGGHYDVMVVDDNSPDRTGDLLDELASKHDRLSVVHRPTKLGLGTAHQLAFLFAIQHGYDRLVTMDADFSHDPEDIPRLLEGLEQADFVIGSRYAEGGDSDYDGYRKLISVSANTLARLLLRIPLHEFTTSFRAFDVATLKDRRCIKIRASGYSFFMETVYRLHRASFRVAEVPIKFKDRHLGVSKIPRFEVVFGIVKLVRLVLSSLQPMSKFVPAANIGDKCAYCDSSYMIEIFKPSYPERQSKQSAATYQCSSIEHKSKPQVVKCLQCDLIQVPQGNLPDNLEDLYKDVEDSTYLENRASREINYVKTYERIERFLPRKGRLLEVGAYCGLFLDYVRRQGWDGEGVEPSNWASNVANNEVGVKVHPGTLEENINNLQTDYDVVVAWDVLEHVIDPYLQIQYIHSLMRPGGVLCLSTLDIDNWFPKLLGRNWPWVMDMHLHYFTKELLCRWFERAGYEVLHITKYRHYASLRYIWDKGMAILPSYLAVPLRPLGIIVPAFIVPVSFGDIKLFVVRKNSTSEAAKSEE